MRCFFQPGSILRVRRRCAEFFSILTACFQESCPYLFQPIHLLVIIVWLDALLRYHLFVRYHSPFAAGLQSYGILPYALTGIISIRDKDADNFG
ncbi:hypothetical protein BDW60DRAFT_107336 [Aspergillus nidulans var. acristatus]